MHEIGKAFKQHTDKTFFFLHKRFVSCWWKQKKILSTRTHLQRVFLFFVLMKESNWTSERNEPQQRVPLFKNKKRKEKTKMNENNKI
jgi:CRISPR/Cas system-associated endonuclease Cas3-HD